MIIEIFHLERATDVLGREQGPAYYFIAKVPPDHSISGITHYSEKTNSYRCSYVMDPTPWSAVESMYAEARKKKFQIVNLRLGDPMTKRIEEMIRKSPHHQKPKLRIVT